VNRAIRSGIREEPITARLALFTLALSATLSTATAEYLTAAFAKRTPGARSWPSANHSPPASVTA
jgi:hypothetical protein